MNPDQDVDQDGSGTLDLDDEIGVDPLDDADDLSQNQARRNYAKVGSACLTTLLCTYGPGAIVGLPYPTVMSTGLDDWMRIWRCRTADPVTVHVPHLLETVQLMLGRQANELRHFSRQSPGLGARRDGGDLGVPAWVFSQWMRCTGYDLLTPLSRFVNDYHSAHPFRLGQAVFKYIDYPGRPDRADAAQGRKGAKGTTKRRGRRRSPCIPACYLTAYPSGYLDKLPYDW